MIRVLHVDDDPRFADLTREYLGREDDRFEVVTETSPGAALDHLHGADPAVDCVVSDYALPAMDGLELLGTVRESHPDLPFILFTGRGGEEVAGEALAKGATDYLQKQHGTEQYGLLANRIRNAVDQYRVDRERRRSERYRQDLYDVAADSTLDVDEKVRRLLALGCERLGVENGHVARVDRAADRHEIWMAAGSDFVEAGPATDLAETYCRETVESEDVLTVYDAPGEGWGDDPAYERWGIGCYIGGRVEVRGALHGTVCFVDQQPRERSFTEPERAFVDRVATWIGHLVERETFEREVRRLETVVDTVPDGVYALDDEEFTFVNDGLVELTGYDEGDLVGADPSLLFDAGTVETLRGGADGPAAPLETTLRTADGTERPVEVRRRRLSDDGDGFAAGTAGVVHDVSERLERDRQADLFQKAQAMAGVGAWEYDLRTDTHYVTEEVLRIHDLPPDADLSPEKSLDYYHPDDEPTVRSAFTRAVESGEPYDLEVRMVTADGEQRWVRTRGEPQSEGGDIVRVRGTIKDVTARKRRERELERQNDRLEEFASVVSHDIRAPLNVALGQLGIAERTGEEEAFRSVRGALERIEAIVDDVLALAKQGRSIGETESVSITRVARDAWETVDTESVTLRTVGDYRVSADPDRLRQLFENLFRNSVEHGATGGSSDADDGVTVTVGPIESMPTTTRGGQDMPEGFYVADDGPGIPADRRDEVFETGYTTADDGTGFGLSIVEEIVAAHGWEVAVTDGIDGGARFEITGVDVDDEGPVFDAG